jgi:hypothetical protein
MQNGAQSIHEPRKYPSQFELENNYHFLIIYFVIGGEDYV